MTTKLRLSINSKLLNKNETGDKALFVSGWTNREVAREELAAEIDHGRAYCVQLTGNYRKAANFLCSDVISVDIDGTRRIEEVLDDDFVRSHLALLYTTPSHTPEKNRFRLVFATARTIVSAQDMVAASLSLTLRLRGDRSTTDAAHIFYGSRGSHPQVFGGSIDESLLDELIAEGRRASQADTARTKGNPTPAPATTVSGFTVSDDLVLTLSDGRMQTFGEIPLGTTIHCPFHFDEHASAFVLESRQKVKGIRCSTCAKTFWPKGLRHPSYDFFSFDTAVKNAQAYFDGHKDSVAAQSGLMKLVVENGPLVHENLIRSNINITESRFLDIKAIGPGLTFVKSPKGTGKTEILRKIVADDNSVLLIGHRVSLIGQSCDRLSLTNYLDFHRDGYLAEHRLGICLDSLHRLTWKQRVTGFKSITKEKLYKTIILDESEQILSHFLSTTMERAETGENRNMRDRLFKIFRRLLKKADRIIALDADLGWLTFETLVKLARKDDPKEHSTQLPIVPGPVSRLPVTIYVNDHKTNREIELFETEGELVSDLMTNLIAGKRVFLTSNSKRRINAIHEMIKAKLGDDFPSIAVTSDNNQSDEVIKLIGDIRREALRYQAILTSPTMGTGVDITFDNEVREIDVVYGLFQPLITTHFDIDQQLARVRQPGQVKVWVSENRYGFDTARSVIKHEIQEREAYTQLLIDYDDDLRPIYHTNDEFTDMAALIVSQQRASKNTLRENFIAYKRHQGWNVRFADSSADDASAGEDLLEMGKAISDDKRLDAILSAPPLRRRDYERIIERTKDREAVSELEKWSVHRTAIELFYREAISEDLVLEDDRSRRRDCVRLFEALAQYENNKVRSSTRFLPDKAASNFMSARFVADTKLRPQLLSRLLSLTPIFDGSFNTDAEFSQADMGEFGREAKRLKPVIENQLGIGVRSDVDKQKPVMFLGRLCELLGLSIYSTRKTTNRHINGGKPIYWYKLSSESLEYMCKLVEVRRAKLAWDTLYQIHGWSPDEPNSDEVMNAA